MTDEDRYQSLIGPARVTLAVLRATRPADDAERQECERLIAHCEWRRDNQDRPHPSKEDRP